MDMLANFNHRSARLRRGIVPAMAAIFISGGTVAVFSADTNPPPAKVALVIPRSVFVDDLTKGKDPFFPGTSRRLDKTAAVIAGPGSAAPPNVSIVTSPVPLTETKKRSMPRGAGPPFFSPTRLYWLP